MTFLDDNKVIGGTIGCSALNKSKFKLSEKIGFFVLKRRVFEPRLQRSHPTEKSSEKCQNNYLGLSNMSHFSQFRIDFFYCCVETVVQIGFFWVQRSLLFGQLEIWLIKGQATYCSPLEPPLPEIGSIYFVCIFLLYYLLTRKTRLTNFLWHLPT